MDPTAERSEAVTTWKRWLFGPSLRNRALLYEEIASLAGAGIGLRETLEQLRDRSGGARRRALGPLADAVEFGVAPGDAMLRKPEHFAPVEARIVAAAERTGRYDAAFREAAAECERARTALTKLLRAIAYPLFLLHFALFVPCCSLMRTSSSMAYTQVVIWTVFLGFWTAVLVLLTLHLSRRSRPGYAKFLGSIPFVGAVSRSAALSRACGVAAILHAGGGDLPDTLEHAADAATNGWIGSGFRAAAATVRQGQPAAPALHAVEAFGPEAWSLLETGERSGSLDQSFAVLARIEAERYEAAMPRLALGIGGFLFACAGLAVFLMFASLLGKLYGGL